MLKKYMLFFFNLIIFLFLTWNSFWYLINDYFILDKWHDLYNVDAKPWWWYVPKINYNNSEAVRNRFKFNWYYYMQKFYSNLWLEYKYIDWKKNNSQFYVNFEKPLVLRNFNIIKKILPDIYFSYKDPKQNSKIKWIQWKKVNKYILWWYWSKNNQLLILYPIIRKFNWKTEAFLEAPCWNMICYNKNKCLQKINYNLKCELNSYDNNNVNRNWFYDYENINLKTNIYLNWKKLSNFLITKLKIKYWWLYQNNRLLTKKRTVKIHLNKWKYIFQSYIIDPFTNQKINCTEKTINVRKKSNTCSFILKQDWKVLKNWSTINLLNWLTLNWDIKPIWFFYRSKRWTWNRWKRIPINELKNFKLNNSYDTYQFAVIARDLDYKKNKICWLSNVKTTWNPWCKINNIRKCYNYWDKIYPIIVFNYDTYLKSIIYNMQQKYYKTDELSRFYLIANKEWKNIFQANVYNKYSSDESNCSAEFYVNPRKYCWDWITNNNEQCDYNDPKNWFYCNKDCTIKKISKCEIIWLNYAYINNNYSYYIKLPDFSNILSVKINWLNYWTNKYWNIKISNNSNIIWKKVKILVKITNIYNWKDINYCEKEIVIKKKPIWNYCDSN